MEIIREDIQCLRIKNHAESQVTFDVDFNVPDTKPDVGRIIQSKGEVQLPEVRVSEDHVYIKGSLTADVLYVDEDYGKVSSLTARLPVDETINLEGIVNGDKICVHWELEDLSIHLIHSRKMNIKAIVTFEANVEDLKGIRLPTGVKDPEISMQKKNIEILNLAVHKKDTLRIRDEITLAANRPDIDHLIWNHMEIRGLDLKPGENAIQVKGEISVFVLYEGTDAGRPIQWLEYSLPFQKEAECSGCREDLIPNIQVSVLSKSIEVKPDADGEERILQVDVVLEMDMKLYREEKYDLLMDVYTPSKECVLQTRPEVLEKLRIRNDSRCRINERIDLKESKGKVLQVCHTLGRVKVDKETLVKDGIQVEGIVQMKILYITGDDEMPFYSMEAVLPFRHVAEARGITEEDQYYLKTELEQLTTTMTESSQLEVRASIRLNTLVLKPQKIELLEQVTEEPLDMEKIRNMPGITVYYMKPGDTLWEVARKYHTTVQEICEQNMLGEREPETGTPLILVKPYNLCG